MDYKSKYQFYNEMYEDYLDQHDNSFIYKYFKKQKDHKVEAGTGRSKSNQYVYLQTCYRKYQEKTIPGPEMVEVLEKLLVTLTLDEMKEIMAINGVGMSKKELVDKLKKEIEIEFQASLLPEDGISIRLIKGLSKKYIDEDIENFFYNTGIKSGNVGRRRDGALDMFFEFINIKDREKTPHSGNAFTADRLNNDDYINDCKELYNLLNDIELHDGHTIFVPVLIDSDTGLGLYMVGGDIIDANEKEKRNCYFCCLRFDYDVNFFGEHNVEHDDSDLYEEPNSVFDMRYYIENKYTDLEEAIKFYFKLKAQYKDYEGYEFVNEAIADEIEDSDVVRFLNYFVPQKEVDRVIERRKDKTKALEKYERERAFSQKMSEEKERRRSRSRFGQKS